MRASKVMENRSRSDLVRERRTQRSQQNISRTRQAASRPVPSQPVIVRGTHPSAARPLRNSTQSRVRRQYYYALGASGAEVRLPAIPFLRPDWRILSGILAVLLVLAIYALLFSPQFQVQSVDIQGIQRLTPGDIEAVLEAKGTQIINFNPVQAKEKLATAFPELSAIKIAVGLPAHVVIQVSEREPVVSWNVGDTAHWVDAEGTILPPRGEAGNLLAIETNGLPTLLPQSEADTVTAIKDVKAPSNTDVWGRRIDPAIVKALIDLQSRLPAGSGLVYNTGLGLGWKDARGWDVFIGKDLSNFDLKVTMYQDIIAQLEQQGKLPTQLVSVEFTNAPFYK